MADVITGNTELAATKMAVIAAAAQKSLAFAAKLVPLFTDLSYLAGKGAKSISIPKLTEFTVTNRATSTAADAVDLTASVDTLLLNKVPHINFIIDPQDEIQSTLNVQMEFAVRAAAAQGRYVDTQIVAELESVGTASALTGDISKSWALAARAYIQGNNGDLDNCAIMVSAEQEAVLLGISDFVRYDSTGMAAGQNPTVSGMIGRIFGVPVVMTNAITVTQTYYMAEKSGLGYAFQRAVQIGVQSEVKYGPTAQRWAIEAQFGVKGLQIQVGSAASGKSALVFKDGN